MKRKLASLERIASTRSGADETFATAEEMDAAVLREREARERRKRELVPHKNKQRTLVFCSRGVTTRYRHLMEDLRALLPHHRREVKHDTKKKLHEINEICELKSCNNCIFFDVRKKKICTFG